jgi:hypothetical protein
MSDQNSASSGAAAVLAEIPTGEALIGVIGCLEAVSATLGCPGAIQESIDDVSEILSRTAPEMGGAQRVLAAFRAAIEVRGIDLINAPKARRGEHPFGAAAAEAEAARAAAGGARRR